MPFGQFDAAMREVAENVEFNAVGDPVTFTRRAGIKLSRKGKRIALVQLGDIPDRGHFSLLCFQILASIG